MQILEPNQDDDIDKGKRMTRFGDLVSSGQIQGATGPTCLVLEIINRARQDFLFEKIKWLQTDAARFFSGELYKHYLSILGLPVDYLPEGITRERIKYQLAKYPIADYIVKTRLFGKDYKRLFSKEY